MIPEPSSDGVQSEVDEHKEDLLSWSETIAALTIPTAMKDVTNRFIRDCYCLIADIDGKETPSSRDLSDYVDRRNSLEIQYNSLAEELR